MKSPTKLHKMLYVEWYTVFIPDEELQAAYEVLLHLYHADDDHPMEVAKAAFFCLTEELLEKYCVPFYGGLEWDNRRNLLK